MLKQKISSVIVGLLIFIFFPFTSQAQSTSSVSIQISPENYSAGEQVTLSLSSFTVTLDTASIVWEIDGEEARKGVGMKEIKIDAPVSGEEKEVFVAVTTKSGVVERTIILKPETIDFYIESVDGFIPPWYQGRSRIAEEGVVKVVAVPDSFNAIGGDDSRVYTWSKNNFKDPSQSGRGRQAYITKLSPFVNSEDITVEVGGMSKTTTLTPQATSISLYENSPLVGTRFEKELSNDLNLTKEDVTFEVIPWFFSAPNRNSNALSVSWTINGLPTRAQGNRSLLNLRKGTTQKGRAVIGVTVKHKERTLQSNRATLNIDL